MGIEKQPDLYACELCSVKEYEGGTKNPPWLIFNIEGEAKSICFHCTQELKSAIDGHNVCDD